MYQQQNVTKLLPFYFTSSSNNESNNSSTAPGPTIYSFFTPHPNWIPQTIYFPRTLPPFYLLNKIQVLVQSNPPPTPHPHPHSSSWLQEDVHSNGIYFHFKLMRTDPVLFQGCLVFLLHFLIPFTLPDDLHTFSSSLEERRLEYLQLPTSLLAPKCLTAISNLTTLDFSTKSHPCEVFPKLPFTQLLKQS